ncbi:MAG: DUF4332 domain-containing protein [Chloroflexota bacterium]|nr:DUF4332 domain-containing protein [Chloroflexota bacterium]
MPPTENLQRVPQVALDRLIRQGLFTTGLFLEVSETPTRRLTLADQVGVSINEINQWRDEALLLNLANFGPNEQRILNQARVVGLQDILDCEPVAFHDRVTEAAHTLGVETPTDLTIQGWYDQAQTLAEG